MFTHNDCALDFRGRRSIFIRKPVDHHQQQHRLHCGLLYFIFFFFFILSCEGFLGFHSFDTAFFFFFFHHSSGGVGIYHKIKKYFVSRIAEWKHGADHDQLGAATGKRKKKPRRDFDGLSTSAQYRGETERMNPEKGSTASSDDG